MVAVAGADASGQGGVREMCPSFHRVTQLSAIVRLYSPRRTRFAGRCRSRYRTRNNARYIQDDFVGNNFKIYFLSGDLLIRKI